MGNNQKEATKCMVCPKDRERVGGQTFFRVYPQETLLQEMDAGK